MTISNQSCARLGVAVAAAIMAMQSGPVVAQQQAPGARPTLEELTVTARRREESIFDVPIAISALDSVAIESAGLRDVIELSRLTPGLYARVGGNGRIDRANTQLTFRGLSVRSGIFFIDGAPYGGPRRPDVADVARVEVLKGPQSVYFGRSTFSGAVNFVTKDPGDTFAGRIRADVYSYDGSDIQLMLEGPLAENLGVRVSGRHYRFGGFYENGGDPNTRMGRQGTDSISANILFTPTERLRVRSFLSFAEDDDGVSTAAALKSGVELFCDTGGNTIAPPGGNFYACGRLPKVSDLDPRIVISVNDSMDDRTYNAIIANEKEYPVTFDPTWKTGYGMRRQTATANAGIDYEFDSGYVLTSTSAFARTRTQQIVDQLYRDGRRTPNPRFGTPQFPLAPPFIQFTLLLQNIVNNFSQELRLTSPDDERFRWTFGANYYRQWGPSSTNSGYSLTGYHNGTAVKTGVETPAVFGGAYFDITEALTLGVEGRYQWDGIRQQPTFPNVSDRLKATFTSFSPRITLDYNLGNHLVYGLYSRGYQPGGFNPALVAQDPFIVEQIIQAGANLTYDEEKLDTFEVGFKSNWLDGRLRTAVAVYMAKWKDGQVNNQVFPLRLDGSVVQTSVTTNIGRIDLKGIELEGDFAVTDNLVLNATLNLADNEIKEYVYLDGLRIINSTDVTGNQLDQVPKWSWSFSPVYTARLNDNFDWFTRLDWTGRDKIYVDPTNVAWIQGTNRFNLRAGIQSDRLRLEAYVNNLSNDKTLDEGTRAADVLTSFPPRGNEIRIGLPSKRTYGIVVSYDF